MSADPIDMTPFILAKSDQLNADDLVGGPIRVQVLGVTVTSGEQPVTVKISGGHMPWKTSKTARRVLVAVWGTDASKWIGRWMDLYRDESVQWAGKAVGGIRVAAVSHISKPVTLSLALAKGKKSAHTVGVLKPDDCKPHGIATANLDAFLAEQKLTREDVDRWLTHEGKPTLEAAPEKVPGLAAWLAADPKRIDAIRALVPSREPGEDE